MWLELPSSRGDQEASGLAPEVGGGRFEDSTADKAGPPTNLMCLQLLCISYVFVVLLLLTRQI
jgi:hypothetical protein